MNMKGLAFKSVMMATLLSLPMMLCGCNGNNKGKQETPVVYFTKDISPEALVKLYEALGVEAQGKVAVKISTGESEKDRKSPRLNSSHK